MKITDKQEEFLSTLTCQRLSDDPANKRQLRNFKCSRNRQLAAYLRYYGWEEDTAGTTTYYVVKNQENKILMYFSLKCGTLFEPLKEESLYDAIRRYNRILDDIHSVQTGQADEKTLAELERLQVEFGMNLNRLDFHLRSRIHNKTNKLQEIEQDRRETPNDWVSRVMHTYPAVEIVHFVVNDEARAFWTKAKMKYRFTKPLGEVMFWRFVAPVLCSVQNTLGCEYVYLFAADDSEDRTLVNYYQVALNFEQPENIGANKPRYDFTCEFLCQQLSDLRRRRTIYFDHFNPAIGEALI